jgi:hypothetical protein
VAGVARVADHGLLGAFLGGFDIGHSGLLKIGELGVSKIEKYGRKSLLRQ